MPEQVVLEHSCSDGICRLHVMGDGPVEVEIPLHAKVYKGVDAGIPWLKAEWLWRDAALLYVAPNGFEHWAVLWGLLPGERISQAVVQAAGLFQTRFGRLPEHAFVRNYPAGVAYGILIPVDGGEVNLHKMPGLMAGFVAVR